MIKYILFPVIMFSLSACSGNVLLTPLAKDQINNQAPPAQYGLDPSDVSLLDKGYPGVIAYFSRPVIEIDRYTQIQVPGGSDGKSIILSNDCDSSPGSTAEFQKIVQIADRDHPFLVHYKSALLETYTFAVTLNADDTLASINVSSTPDQGKTISSAASTVSAFAALNSPKPSGKATCTQTPVFVRYTELPAH